MVVFDTSILSLLFDQNPGIPTDPTTGNSLEFAKSRVANLIVELEAESEKIIIPTPVLAEYMIRGGADKIRRYEIISQSKNFTITPFDSRAAIECSHLLDGMKANRSLTEDETYAKMRFDRQIIAIAKVHDVSCVFTGDKGLASCAEKNNLKVRRPWELEIPDSDKQNQLFSGD